MKLGNLIILHYKNGKQTVSIKLIVIPDIKFRYREKLLVFMTKIFFSILVSDNNDNFRYRKRIESVENDALYVYLNLKYSN